LPFEIPSTWAWTRTTSVTYPVGNKDNQIFAAQIQKKGTIPVVSQGQNIIDGYCECKEKVVDDLPLIMFGDHTRNVKFIDFPFVIGADGTKFHKSICINPYYLYYWMMIIAEQLKDRGYARHYSLLKQEFIPLPPLREQDRIVLSINGILKSIEGV
jgi:type I restriction enzyme S subunit